MGRGRGHCDVFGWIKVKFKNKGDWMHWMGFAKDRTVGTYKIFNPATRSVIRTRDIKFTKPDSVRSTDESPVATVFENKGQEYKEHQGKPIGGKVIHLVSNDKSASKEEMNDCG